MICVGFLTHSWGAGEGESVFFAVLTGFFLFINLRNFFLETSIILNNEGIALKEVFYTRKRPWSKCKSLHIDRCGVLVSPFSYPTRLENFRGIYLRFEGNKDEVMTFLKRKIKSKIDVNNKS